MINKIKKLLIPLLIVSLLLTSIPLVAFAKPKDELLSERADEILAEMTMNEKLAQLLLAYLPKENPKATQKKYQVGGYVLFARDFENVSKAKRKELIKSYQSVSKINMLMAVDEEGGTVVRASKFKQYRNTPFKTDKYYYQNGGWDNVIDKIHSKDRMLKSIGLNTNLAPVADVAYSSSNYMYSRSFSTNADKTAKYIRKTVKQMKSDNVVSTLKHFPGYGGNGNTHTNIIRDKRSLKTFQTRDLKPFQAGIDAGCDMIMMSHNIVYAFDKKNPVSISKKAHNYLRDEMGFEGVIVSDGIQMAGVLDFVGGDVGEAVVRAIIAGNDMVCTGAIVRPMKALKKAVKDGRLTEKRVNKSVKRILILKLKRGIIK